uniref:Uncharacterized protein n=1 Tax=Trichobilharzia regenti TaxID=157069 RepID=A0AA85J6R3_TRIRE|nr:unnamed protein product [Trichobilharzia regenti]
MTLMMHNSVRIIQNFCSFTSVFLRRNSNAALVTVRPQLSDKQRRTIDSCCTVEVTADRLSYAFLRLDLEDRNSVILSSWNSLPLNLPSGKEFRPSVCSSTAFHCSNILKEQILSNHNVPLNMDVILRPVVPSTCFTTTTITTGKYPKDNLIMHQAVVTGYLLAFLSNHTNDEFHQNCQASISLKCPTVETLVNWTNQSTSHWVQYLNQLFLLSYKNDQFITFNLLPKSSKHLCTVKNSKIMPVQEEINMRLQSEQLLSVFRASNMTKRKDSTTMQFLLARCLFTCMYHLFHDNYSRIV